MKPRGCATSERSRQILDAVISKPGSNIPALHKEMGITRTILLRHLNLLRADGKVYYTYSAGRRSRLWYPMLLKR
ncbi:MAG: hypothetical protein KME15_19985 [Drouetiella hepatica Uher 2000/2452]|jgi:predicted ArsR family transcriptional regulator|uniref:Uncharacterized protein n=1 Tax=Drouetiella hepatica Uher 2000/2452 TaxID=904376 RepID=A0A951QDS8_9CYAN|nr:hypothetical protein [Drouetiella hepatica Uher 2000/2452]